MQSARSGTGLTLGAFVAGCVILSAAPVPDWMKPLDVFTSEQPVKTFFARILSRPDAVPRPSQGYVAGGGALDIAAEDMTAVDDEPEVEAPAEIAVSRRAPRRWTPPERPRFERWAARLGLEAAPLELGCADPRPSSPASNDPEASDRCRRRALDRFFARLREVDTASSTAPAVRVLHFGDSLIASDKITDRVRLRMQERFGSAGRGFLMIRKFNRFQRGNRTGDGTGGWLLDVITQGVLQDRFFGYTGASFTAQTARERTVFSPLAGSRYVEVYFLEEPQGGAVEVSAGDVPLGVVDTRGSKLKRRARVQRFELPDGAESVRLQATRAGARVFGVVLEADVPGVVYESIGLPGATSEVWLRPAQEDFGRMLAARRPALVVHMVGGNDALMLSKRRSTVDEVETSMHAFFDRVEEAVPEADCLVVSPLESVRAKADGRMTPKPEVLDIIDIQRAVAKERGCGFWSLYESMGGEGSLAKWVAADLMLGDLIHPRSRGSDLLGEMMAEAIMRAYDDAARSDATGRRDAAPAPEQRAGG
jgi:lysophospholipase L1-like esterase